ncbi:hypothetical protein ACP70R_022106 [Stipagrostis hirtigluma subsp. patula]
MARLRSLHRATLVPILLVLLLMSLSAVAATTTTTTTIESCSQLRSRKLLVTVPRVSPETPSEARQQEMVVGGRRVATPFWRAGANLGRRVPGSHANPSHN